MDEIANIISKVAKNSFNKKVNVSFKSNEILKRKPGIILCNKKLQNLGWTVKFSLQNGITELLTFLASDDASLPIDGGVSL